MKLRVGIVGIDRAWETKHRPALRALSDRLEVRGVCDPVAHRAHQIAKEFDAAQVDGYRALVQRADVDAVLLLSPCWYGWFPILAACHYGKSIYCGTAFDLPVEEARQVRQRVEEAGVAFLTGFPYRQFPAVRRLKELIATKLGQPRLMFCHKRRRENDAGHGKPMHSLMQEVDWCRYLVGIEPTAVTGIVHRSQGVTALDYEMMSLDFSPPDQPGTGPLAQISCGSYVLPNWHEAPSFRPPADLQVSCERGIAFLDLPSGLVWFNHAGQHRESLESERPAEEQLLFEFCRAVMSLVRSTKSLDDAFRAMTIVGRAEQSAAEGRRVELDF